MVNTLHDNSEAKSDCLRPVYPLPCPPDSRPPLLSSSAMAWGLVRYKITKNKISEKTSCVCQQQRVHGWHHSAQLHPSAYTGGRACCA